MRVLPTQTGGLLKVAASESGVPISAQFERKTRKRRVLSAPTLLPVLLFPSFWQASDAATGPQQDVGCIRDLIYLYESCTTEDVYNAYDFLALEDENLYTCKGIAGPPELLQKHTDVEAMVIEVEGESDSEGAFGWFLIRCVCFLSDSVSVVLGNITSAKFGCMHAFTTFERDAL